VFNDASTTLYLFNCTVAFFFSYLVYFAVSSNDAMGAGEEEMDVNVLRV